MTTLRLRAATAAALALPIISLPAVLNLPMAHAQQCTPASVRKITHTREMEVQVPNLFSGSSAGIFGGSSSGSSGGNSDQPSTRTEIRPAGIAAQLISADGPTKSIQFITGPQSPNRTDANWNITSTDLGLSYTDGQHTYLAFGDTFLCGQQSAGWRSNALVRTRDKNLGDGLHLDQALTNDGWSDAGAARQFIDSRKVDGVEMTTIPTAGIVVNGRHYIDYMSVRKWLQPGQWDTNYAGTVSAADGTNWSLDSTSVRVNRDADRSVTPDGAHYQPGYENLQMSAFIQPQHADEGDYVYRISTANGRFGNAYLSRVRPGSFPRESAFEYWTGTSWSSSASVLQNAAAPLFGDRVSELSVTYNRYLDKYVALYMREGTGLVVRTADRLTGPWSDERVLISLSTVPQLYGAFVIPGQDDQHLYYAMSTWDDYNVYLMRTDLDFAMRNNIHSDNISVADIIR